MTIKKNKQLRTSRRRRIASVSSLIEFRAKRQSTPSQALQIVGSSLRNDVGPLCDSSPADTECASDMNGLFEVGNDVGFVHATMLTIVHRLKQPCSATNQITLVSMSDWQDCKTLVDRLAWAQAHSKVSRKDLADTCGISTVAVGRWFNGEVDDIKLDNFFRASSLMVVNPKWLAIGEDTPFTAIPSIYRDIDGVYLRMAKELTEIDSKSLKATIQKLIEAETGKPEKTKNSKRKRSQEIHA